MRSLGLEILLVSALVSPFCVAAPAPVAPNSVGGQFCHNHPATPAGSFLPARSVSDKDHALDPRFRDTILWCARGTSTYLIIELISNLQPTGVLSVLANALFGIQDHIAQHGDGLLQHGIFMFDLLASENIDCHFYAANTNNHQLTWGVVGAAVQALSNYMLTENNAGIATFTIYDGGTEVGFGSVDVVPAKK